MDEDIVFDSECFRDLRYIVKDKHLILKSNNNGTFAISLSALLYSVSLKKSKMCGDRERAGVIPCSFLYGS